MVSKFVLVCLDREPPDGDQHPDHGLVGTAWFPVKIVYRPERDATYREVVHCVRSASAVG